MYAGDNQDALVNNYSYANATCGPQAWVCPGSQFPLGSWTGDVQTDTTDMAIRSGPLFTYNNNPAIYLCSVDTAKVPGTGTNLTRNVSMSSGMNFTDALTPPTPTNAFIKLHDIANPGPSDASVFVEEADNSIDNNVLGIYPGTPSNPAGGGTLGYWNLPSSRHNNGCVISFADGHAEYWRWKSPYINNDNLAGAYPIGLFAASGPGDTDVLRLKLTVPPSGP